MPSGGKAALEPDARLVWLREEPCTRSPAHSRARIAAAAVALADSEGFEAVSMRRVAQELGAGTMTLYHYVANKDELVTLMVDAVMGEILVAEDEMPAGWRPAIAAIATSSREALRRHRWMLDRLGDGRPGPNGMRHFEQSLEAMSSAGISSRAMFEAIVLVDEYVFGFAIREAQESAEHDRGWAPGVREFFQRELDSGGFPRVRELLGDDADAAVNRVADVFFEAGRFERGLKRLLDGIEAGLKPAG
ncbi:MAG TPA: TetR/AcrR family transcriptional regulator [Solirubrobacterales bacterium]|jgi:AcrR family transcriptional regulator|nr:TetR/AcrR family transcriptional regulator [Solirubrobacterales bacterium]